MVATQYPPDCFDARGLAQMFRPGPQACVAFDIGKLFAAFIIDAERLRRRKTLRPHVMQQFMDRWRSGMHRPPDGVSDANGLPGIDSADERLFLVVHQSNRLDTLSS